MALYVALGIAYAFSDEAACWINKLLAVTNTCVNVSSPCGEHALFGVLHLVYKCGSPVVSNRMG